MLVSNKSTSATTEPVPRVAGPNKDTKVTATKDIQVGPAYGKQVVVRVTEREEDVTDLVEPVQQYTDA